MPGGHLGSCPFRTIDLSDACCLQGNPSQKSHIYAIIIFFYHDELRNISLCASYLNIIKYIFGSTYNIDQLLILIQNNPLIVLMNMTALQDSWGTLTKAKVTTRSHNDFLYK